MPSVVDLAAYRERRARAKSCLESQPPDSQQDDQILLRWQPNGSYRATITGIYAEFTDKAVEAMVDAILRLGAENPLLAINEMASAIHQLSIKAQRSSKT